MFTKGWKLYGQNGHRQRESFCNSYSYNFSNEKGGTRLLTVLNSDVTGTNDYSIVIITRDTEKAVDEEFEGQLFDGIFENSNFGDVIPLNLGYYERSL